MIETMLNKADKCRAYFDAFLDETYELGLFDCNGDTPNDRAIFAFYLETIIMIQTIMVELPHRLPTTSEEFNKLPKDSDLYDGLVTCTDIINKLSNHVLGHTVESVYSWLFYLASQSNPLVIQNDILRVLDFQILFVKIIKEKKFSTNVVINQNRIH